MTEMIFKHRRSSRLGEYGGVDLRAPVHLLVFPIIFRIIYCPPRSILQPLAALETVYYEAGVLRARAKHAPTTLIYAY